MKNDNLKDAVKHSDIRADLTKYEAHDLFDFMCWDAVCGEFIPGPITEAEAREMFNVNFPAHMYPWGVADNDPHAVAIKSYYVNRLFDIALAWMIKHHQVKINKQGEIEQTVFNVTMAQRMLCHPLKYCYHPLTPEKARALVGCPEPVADGYAPYPGGYAVKAANDDQYAEYAVAM